MSAPVVDLGDGGEGSSAGTGAAPPSVPQVVWTEVDAKFTALFRAWDNLPISDVEREIETLAELDDMISAFDVHVRHSEDGFRSWVRRHQEAMESGLVDIPTWPKLGRRVPNGSWIWANIEWDKRYSSLIRQREQLVNRRLAALTHPFGMNTTSFFGASAAPARKSLLKAGGKPLVLDEIWYLPLETLLVILAQL